MDFKLKTKPYAHQLKALKEAFGRQAFALFCEQGTGKSKIIVDEVVNLVLQRKLNCAVILAPNQLHKNWADQFAIHSDCDQIEIQVWQGAGPKLAKFEEETRRIIRSGKCLVFLMNIEALSAGSGYDYVRRILLARRQSYICIDESHKIKTPGAQRTKRAIDLGKLAMYRRIGTGTEAEEGVEGLYSQFRFLSPNIIGTRTYSAFKGMFCVLGGYENREILGYQNQDVLAAKIAPHTFQIRKKQCLDLPDQVYERHRIDATPEQLNLYNTLRDELLLEFNDKLIDATLVLTRLLRLQQILCGHLDNTPIPSHRARFVAELCEAEGGKSIVFCRFRADVRMLTMELQKDNIRAALYTGMQSPAERDDQLLSWRQERDCKVLISTTGSGGVGLTLNESSNTIFYSNSWSSTDRYQAEARNHRIGQSNKVTYHDIVVPGLVDDKLLAALRAKQNAAEKFRSMVQLKQFLDGESIDVGESSAAA